MKKNCTIIVFAVMLLYCVAAVSDIAGIITDDDGGVVANARVFAEPGIEGAVVEGVVSTDGTFSIAGDFYGDVGVFAKAPGRGYGGIHLNIAAGDRPQALHIELAPETRVTGTVTDHNGAPVSGARISSIAITHPVKVGIPLSKLAGVGIETPLSDSAGRFQVDGIPHNGRIALKFEHHAYAQEALMDIAAGAGDVSVTMHRGVTIRGQVSIRGTDTLVSGATVAARNAQPPHDTAFSVSDGAGVFTMRLKPGVYLFQAYAAGRISPGLQRVDVSGALPEQQLRLALSETSRITGTIHDASTGDPVPGVRVLLETQGEPAGAARTGADGQFLLRAAAGENILHFDSIPGYLPPDTRALRVSAPGGETLELAGLWLAPIPEFNLHVFEDDGETPVAGAFITLLRPQQFGWQQADSSGRAQLRFTTMPKDNRVFGFAEHPGRMKGALFALDRQNAQDASVALLPLATVKGRVVNENGAPVVGATVGALYADDALPEALPLWRCLTDGNGAFRWPAVPAGVPQRCLASFGAIDAAAQQDINPAPGEVMDIGVITLSGAASQQNDATKPYDELTHLCGPTAVPGDAGLLALYCTPAEAFVYMQAANSMRKELRPLDIETLVAVTGEYACDEAAVPVYKGGNKPPAAYLYDRNGALALRAVGAPPLAALRALQEEHP